MLSYFDKVVKTGSMHKHETKIENVSIYKIPNRFKILIVNIN